MGGACTIGVSPPYGDKRRFGVRRYHDVLNNQESFYRKCGCGEEAPGTTMAWSARCRAGRSRGGRCGSHSKGRLPGCNQARVTTCRHAARQRTAAQTKTGGEIPVLLGAGDTSRAIRSASTLRTNNKTRGPEAVFPRPHRLASPGFFRLERGRLLRAALRVAPASRRAVLLPGFQSGFVQHFKRDSKKLIAA